MDLPPDALGAAVSALGTRATPRPQARQCASLGHVRRQDLRLWAQPGRQRGGLACSGAHARAGSTGASAITLAREHDRLGHRLGPQSDAPDDLARGDALVPRAGAHFAPAVHHRHRCVVLRVHLRRTPLDASRSGKAGHRAERALPRTVLLPALSQLGRLGVPRLARPAQCHLQGDRHAARAVPVG